MKKFLMLALLGTVFMYFSPAANAYGVHMGVQVKHFKHHKHTKHHHHPHFRSNTKV
jgi:hypothetical protein